MMSPGGLRWLSVVERTSGALRNNDAQPNTAKLRIHVLDADSQSAPLFRRWSEPTVSRAAFSQHTSTWGQRAMLSTPIAMTCMPPMQGMRRRA
jgi:hypothetical protein